MRFKFTPREVALAAFAAIGSVSVGVAPTLAGAAGKAPGKYVTGDFHNHTTCSDGSISMQKLVKKVTDKIDTPWGLDWFIQAGHGGNGNRNCTLVEDASLSTPAPIKGDNGGVGGNGSMWRWQSIQEFQYPLLEYLSAVKNLPLFIGVESVVAGHEHTSMSVITGQMPTSLDNATLPSTPGYTALGDATALAKWEYCFDRGDGDTSRGNVTGSANGNNWNCSVTGS